MCRNILVLIFSITSISVLNGQFLDKDYLYADLALGGGNFKSGTAALTYVNKNGLSFGASIQLALRSSVNKPASYQSGFDLFNIPFIPEGPHDELLAFEATIGKTWPLFKETYKARLHLQGGFGWAQYTTTANWRSEPGGGGIGCLFCGERYDYNQPQITTLLLSIYPKIEIPLGRVYGMSLGPKFLVTGQAVSIQLVWSQMIGIVRPKKHEP